MDPPPTCPNCPERLLWKDTRETGPGKEDSWFWFCAGCRQAYVPTPDQKLRFTYAGGCHRKPGGAARACAGGRPARPWD
ncbi:hypothetical protein DTL70_31985 [Streptomyces diacarni]|uniref:Uncharacterized protein n=1 Tax=Streptomyces diacarni TaxID=2800381 RepID=A0A367E904_9ACTN|nr:hypothetical protein [Streptomyces diacarni]RCG14269.1 hypothetical protein DTL70_31985 [Streptomyces diacarni]